MDSSKILSIEGSVNLSMIVAEQLITNCLEWIFQVLNFSAPVRTFIRCPEIDWQSWFEGLPVDHQSAAGEMKTKVPRQQSTSPLASYRIHQAPPVRPAHSKEPDAILGTETTEGPDDLRYFLSWTISWSSR